LRRPAMRVQALQSVQNDHEHGGQGGLATCPPSLQADGWTGRQSDRQTDRRPGGTRTSHAAVIERTRIAVAAKEVLGKRSTLGGGGRSVN
jgi:hypothetical protein